MSVPAAIVIGVVLPALFPSAAAAHLVNTGLGPFYDGAMHLLLSPSDLLGLLAAALLAGLHGPATSRMMVLTLPAAWFGAGLAGLYLPVGVDLPWLSVISFVALGILVAVNPKLPHAVVAVLAGLYGALHGLLNGSALAAIGAGWPMLLGITATVLTIGLLCSAGIVLLQAAWARIAVRVAGSWVAAVGMLMLGWLARGVN